MLLQGIAVVVVPGVVVGPDTVVVGVVVGVVGAGVVVAQGPI